jgi:hypothetical protein
MQPKVEQLQATQAPELNQELRISTDTATWLAETLHGSMQTKFEFSFDNQELKGEDGGSLDEIFDDAIEEAKAMAEWNPSLLFELRRRLIEREELDEMYEMVQGNRPNTMIVISDFPPELTNAPEDVGGYNVNRQQTMMRIITLGEDGKLRITSQSLDGSNRQALEAIYATMGEPVQEGELLSQRIHRDLPVDWQDNLAGNLTKVYGSSLTEQYGGEWYAGISQHPDRNIVNTYDFILEQQDLIDWFTQQKMTDPVGAEKYRYKVAATAKARHGRYVRSQNMAEPALGLVSLDSFVTVRGITNAQTLLLELSREGKQAAARGEVFSGCGETVSSEESSGEVTEDQLGSSGYGNKSGSKSDDGECEFISKECPECHEKNVKTRVTKTHITGSCGCSKRRKPKQPALV